jgi:hypothetical protein
MVVRIPVPVVVGQLGLCGYQEVFSLIFSRHQPKMSAAGGFKKMWDPFSDEQISQAPAQAQHGANARNANLSLLDADPFGLGEHTESFHAMHLCG